MSFTTTGSFATSTVQSSPPKRRRYPSVRSRSIARRGAVVAAPVPAVEPVPVVRGLVAVERDAHEDAVLPEGLQVTTAQLHAVGEDLQFELGDAGQRRAELRADGPQSGGTGQQGLTAVQDDGGLSVQTRGASHVAVAGPSSGCDVTRNGPGGALLPGLRAQLRQALDHGKAEACECGGGCCRYGLSLDEQPDAGPRQTCLSSPDDGLPCCDQAVLGAAHGALALCALRAHVRWVDGRHR